MKTFLHSARALAKSLALASLACLAACDRGSHPSQVGLMAPDFTVADSTRSVHLSDLRGHMVLLNFWASWCPPCVEEMPSLLGLHHRMPSLTILAVSLDEDPDLYHQFLATQHVDLLTVRDAAQKSNALYGTFVFPETYLIDRDGIVRRKFIGAQDWTSPEILNYLRKLQSAN